MDLSKALVCSTLVFVLTDALKRVLPVKLSATWVQLLALAVGVGAIFLVGSTVWAHTQVIGGRTLDTLNTGSKIVAGLIIGGGSTIIDRLGFVSSRDQDAPAPKV